MSAKVRPKSVTAQTVCTTSTPTAPTHVWCTVRTGCIPHPWSTFLLSGHTHFLFFPLVVQPNTTKEVFFLLLWGRSLVFCYGNVSSVCVQVCSYLRPRPYWGMNKAQVARWTCQIFQVVIIYRSVAEVCEEFLQVFLRSLENRWMDRLSTLIKIWVCNLSSLCITSKRDCHIRVSLKVLSLKMGDNVGWV